MFATVKGNVVVNEDQPAAQHGVLRAVGVIAAATLASRVLGFVRDMVVARAFGAGPVTDAFFVAFRIPNLLRRLLAEGALSTAIIPVFTEYLERNGRAEFGRMVRAVTGVATVVLCVVSGLGMLLAPWIVRVMAPGWNADPGLIGLAGRLTSLMFPYILLVGLAALAMGALNAQHRFFTAAIGPAVLNVAMILSVLVLAGRLSPPLFSLAVGVLVGGLGQLLVQLPELGKLGVSLRPSADWSHPAVRMIAGRLWPAVFALAAVQVTVLLNTLLASLLPQGTVSYLYYADRVMEFPLGVFGIALATAVLPTMAAHVARGERRALTDMLGFSLRLSMFVSVPAAVGLVALGHPVVRLLFERGEFSAVDALATTQALAGYAVGLPAFSATRIAAQTFYAMGDTRTPVRVGLASVAANCVLALALMWPLQHAGLALASSLSAYVNVILLYWLLSQRLGPIGGRPMAGSLLRTGGASAVLLLWCVWAGARLGGGVAGAAWTVGAVGVGMLVYLGASAVLRAPELNALVGLLRRRRGQSLPGAGSG
jgi:putative peptidoglycan lipid II flippase